MDFLDLMPCHHLINMSPCVIVSVNPHQRYQKTGPAGCFLFQDSFQVPSVNKSKGQKMWANPSSNDQVRSDDIQLSLEKTIRIWQLNGVFKNAEGLERCSVVKTTCYYSFSRPIFCSQHPRQVAHNHFNSSSPMPGDSGPSSFQLWGASGLLRHPHSRARTHTQT